MCIEVPNGNATNIPNTKCTSNGTRLNDVTSFVVRGQTNSYSRRVFTYYSSPKTFGWPPLAHTHEGKANLVWTLARDFFVTSKPICHLFLKVQSPTTTNRLRPCLSIQRKVFRIHCQRPRLLQKLTLFGYQMHPMFLVFSLKQLQSNSKNQHFFLDPDCFSKTFLAFFPNPRDCFWSVPIESQQIHPKIFFTRFSFLFHSLILSQQKLSGTNLKVTVTSFHMISKFCE